MLKYVFICKNMNFRGLIIIIMDFFFFLPEALADAQELFSVRVAGEFGIVGENGNGIDQHVIR